LSAQAFLAAVTAACAFASSVGGGNVASDDPMKDPAISAVVRRMALLLCRSSFKCHPPL
jgi:hypothetical protein